MLNLNCVICAELFGHSDDVHITTCGHMFHFVCLKQWLERSKSCPQCRNRCTDRNIFRVYFNLANLDVSHIDVGSLQEQLDNSKLQVKVKERELQIAVQQTKNLKDIQKKCMKTINGLEQKLKKNDFLILSYAEQIKILKNEVKAVSELRDEVKSLKHQIETMDGINLILTATSTEAEKLLKTESDPKKLAVWNATLKRELRHCESKKTDMRNVLKVVQHDLRKEIEVKKTHEERILQLESENYQLNEKIKALETTADAKPNNFRAIGLELNKRRMPSFNRDDAQQKLSPMTAAVKCIEESNSPYLNIKSSSIGLVPLFKRTHEGQRAADVTTNAVNKIAALKISPVKTGPSGKTDSSERYSIFKKPRLGMLASTMSMPLMKPLGANCVFNGFGGSEKMDPFARNSDEELDEEDARRARRLATVGASTVTSTSANSLNNRLKAGGLRNFKVSK